MKIGFLDIGHTESDACTPDTTPPTFAGITTLTAASNGSLLAAWSAGSDSTPPISYQVFIQAATATGLFSSGNLVAVTRNLSQRVFTLADQTTYLVGNTTYFVGVRASDAVGNVDANTVSASAVSTGVVPDNFNEVYLGLVEVQEDFENAIASITSLDVSASVEDDNTLEAVVIDTQNVTALAGEE